MEFQEKMGEKQQQIEEIFRLVLASPNHVLNWPEESSDI